MAVLGQEEEEEEEAEQSAAVDVLQGSAGKQPGVPEERQLKRCCEQLQRRGRSRGGGGAWSSCVSSPQRARGKRSPCGAGWKKRRAQSQPVPAVPALNPRTPGEDERGEQCRGVQLRDSRTQAQKTCLVLGVTGSKWVQTRL